MEERNFAVVGKAFFSTISTIPEIYLWIGSAIVFFVLLATLIASGAKKREQKELQEMQEYWTPKRLSDYQKAKKNSEENGIAY